MEAPKYYEKIQKERHLDIPEWEPKEFFDKFLKKWNSFSAIICGSRMAGKSNLLKSFLTTPKGGNLIKKFDTIVIFSETLLNGHYRKMLPNSRLLFDEYKPEVLDMLKQTYLQRKKEGKSYRFLVIWDDMVVKMKWADSIEKFFYNSRHYGGSVFFLTQKCTASSTAWRANTSLFVVLGTASAREKRYIAKEIIADAIEPQMGENTRDWEIDRAAYRLQNEIVKDYNALIITPYCEHKIKQYKAPQMPK